MIRTLIILPLLGGCALIHDNRSNDPKTCQRVVRDLAHNGSYPDPALLKQAVDVACTGIAAP